MKVDYLSLSAFHQGTAAYTHVHEIINGLRKLGVNVTLFIPNYRKPTRSVFIRAWVMIGLQIRLFLYWVAKELPDIFYVRHHYVALPITILAKFLRIPFVVEVNGPVEDFIISWSIPGWLAPFVKRFAYWQCRLGSQVIGVTPGIVHSLKSAYRLPADKVSLILNGVNTDLFIPMSSPDLRRWPQLEGKWYVVFVGALSPWQSIGLMLKAIQMEEWPDCVQLVIAGDGLLREQVDQVRSDRLIYLGNIPYEQVPHLINASLSGLCLIGDERRMETGVSPLKLYEYCACGRPAIVTKMPGLEDFINEAKCGLILPEQNAKALCDAVQYLIDHPIERDAMGRAGAEFIRKGCSWEDRARKTKEILQKVSGGTAD
jgi:glycosyltransferase involved in cell wall biosynthesis